MNATFFFFFFFLGGGGESITPTLTIMGIVAIAANIGLDKTPQKFSLIFDQHWPL